MIRIVTDSMAGIPSKLALEDDIKIASLFVNRDGIEYEDVNMDVDAFYEEIYDMIDNIPTSSQPSQAEFVNLFQDAAQAGDEVLAIFTSSSHSGTLDGALRAARSVMAQHANFRFRIVDSLSNSFDEAFSVFAAVAARDAGCSLDACVDFAKASIASSRIIFTPRSLDFLKAGGRIGDAAAMLGSLMKLCPLITVRDGQTTTLQKVRTHKKALAAIAEIFKSDIETYGFKNAVVQYIGHPDEALLWARNVIEPICNAEVAVVPVSPVVGVHVGPALGLSYECQKAIPGKLSAGFKIPVFAS